jgi:hypothetical protein
MNHGAESSWEQVHQKEQLQKEQQKKYQTIHQGRRRKLPSPVHCAG